MLRSLLLTLAITASLNFFGQDKKYFQQKVDYEIEVLLDDEAHVLRGFERFQYQNNSNESLEFIYIHLWPNAYKNRKTALAKQLLKLGKTEMYFADPEDFGYIDSLHFLINGQEAVLEFDKDHIDIAKLRLSNPLKPGEQIEVSTPFRVKLPSGSISRLGHIDQSYQITQWYPKPAVYDTAGWHPMPYLTQGEFYSEFGSFDVSITLPANYVVGATGDLQTPSEIEWLNEKIKNDSTWVANRIAEDDWSEFVSMNFPKSDESIKTIRFKQEKVHDFAWFADKRYRVLKGEVALPASKEKVDVYTMFTNKEAKLWSKSIEYMHDAIYYYSLWNGDYPYQQATAVDGTISAGGGMEYPNVTVIGASGNAIGLETVIMHEVGHNWFYGILGSNERRYAWLDEGLNSYNEQRYMSTKYPEKQIFVDRKNRFLDYADLNLYGIEDQQFFTYLFTARPNTDQPLNTHSAEFSNINYGAIVYAKSAVYLNYMRHYLGDKTMDSCMHAYFEANKFKHPYPASFQKAFANVSRPTDWFFNDGLNTSKELDYKITRDKQKSDELTVKLKNKGGINGPVLIDLINEDSVIQSVWIHGFEKDTIISIAAEADLVRIDDRGYMPEINRQNNSAKTHGLFRKTEQIQLKLIGSIENPKKSQLYALPAIGFNNPSGFMAGGMFYNSIVPTKKFNYVIAPMYSFKGNSLVGALDLAYRFSPSKSFVESAELGLRGKSYLWYSTSILGDIQYARAEPYLKFYFRPKDYSSFWRHKLELSSVSIAQFNLRDSGVKSLNNFEVFNRINYQSDFNHPVYATNFKGQLEQNSLFLKLDLEVKNETYFTEKLRLKTRVFAGSFLYNNSTLPYYNYRMDGQSTTNFTDYAFDAELLARNNTSFLANQLTETHGGFKVPTAVGQSSMGLIAANFKLHYGKLPMGVFADFGMSNNATAADAGVFVSLSKGVLECYFPLMYSANIKNAVEANGLKYKELIRFKLNLDRWNFLIRARRLEL